MARISHSGAQVIVFMEKCSLLVDRLECTSECNFEVEQKGGQAPAPLPPLVTNPGHDLKPLENTTATLQNVQYLLLIVYLSYFI